MHGGTTFLIGNSNSFSLTSATQNLILFQTNHDFTDVRTGSCGSSAFFTGAIHQSLSQSVVSVSTQREEHKDDFSKSVDHTVTSDTSMA